MPDSLWVEVDLRSLCGTLLRSPSVAVPARHAALGGSYVPIGYAQTVPLDGADGALAGARLLERLASARRADELRALVRVWAVLPGSGVRCIAIGTLSALAVLLHETDLLGIAVPLKRPRRADAPTKDAAPAKPAAECSLLPAVDGPTVGVATCSLVALDALRTFSARAVGLLRSERRSGGAQIGDARAVPKPVADRLEREALLGAAHAGDVGALRALLARPAAHAGGHSAVDVNRAADSGGHTPLHWAAANGHTSAVRLLLLEAVPRADPNAANLIGATPLHLAAAWGRISAARALLAAGARADARTLAGKTTVVVACAHAGDERERARMRALLEGGAERARAEERAEAEEAAQRGAHEQRERGAASARADAAAAARIQASYRGTRARRRPAPHL